jgi:predicted tellurium resistance membrane protein TerC
MDAVVALITLTTLEIVLGIDNVVFISVLAAKLPAAQQPRARRTGLLLAMIMRLLLLLSVTWLIRLTGTLFAVLGHAFSGRDLIFLMGGLFLIAKATFEIHDKLEADEGHASARVPAAFGGVILQIVLLDMVFSLDSVITAVGMADDLWVMATAIVLAIGVMLAAAESIGRFVERHPTVKMLALAFLVLIGVSLVAEGFHEPIPKGYIYFTMGVAVLVEMLNLRAKRIAPPVQLRRRFVDDPATSSPSGS